MTGKNVTSTTMSTFGSRPNPNQMTNSGAIATIGIVWLVTSSGSTARRTGSQRSSAIAAPIANVTESAQPDDRLDQRRDEVAGGGLAEVPQGAEHARRRRQRDRVDAGEADIALPQQHDRGDERQRRPHRPIARPPRRHGRKSFVNSAP